MLMQRVQNLFLGRVSLAGRHIMLWLLVEALECASKLGKILSSQVGDRIERSRLEVFEACMVEDLAHGTLHCLTAEPGRDEWA